MNIQIYLEIKQEYTCHLIDLITPCIHDGIQCIYKQAKKDAEENGNREYILAIFQRYLKGVNDWNETYIEKETNRIKIASGTEHYFDDLVRAIVKTHIILLTHSNNISSVIAETFFNNLSINQFVHRCYIESARYIHNNIFLFYDDGISPLDIKRNQIIVKKEIENSIIRAIRGILPVRLMLKEFLANTIDVFNVSNNPPTQYGGLNQPLFYNNPYPQFPNVPQNKIPISPLENKVMNAIATENKLSNEQKIGQLMEIEKIITERQNEKNKSSHSKTRSSTTSTTTTVKKKASSQRKNKMSYGADETNIDSDDVTPTSISSPPFNVKFMNNNETETSCIEEYG